MSELPETTFPTRSDQGPKAPRGNCNNMLGKNQYKDRPLANDPHVAALLKGYHLKGITDSRVISKRLLEEHSIVLGHASISQRRKKLGLWASRLTTAELSDSAKRKLIVDQMAKDPTGKMGATSVKKNIFQDTGFHLTRDYIREEMKKLDPVAHAARGPAHVKEKRRKLQETRAATGLEMTSFNLDPDNLSQTLNCDPSQTDPIDTALSTPSLSSHPLPSSPKPLEDSTDFSEIAYPYAEPQSPYLLPPIQPDLSDGAQLMSVPTPSQETSSLVPVTLNMLKETAPKMQEITRLIASLHLDHHQLDTEGYNIVLQGMESAALLERQLSRFASFSPRQPQ